MPLRRSPLDIIWPGGIPPRCGSRPGRSGSRRSSRGDSAPGRPAGRCRCHQPAMPRRRMHRPRHETLQRRRAAHPPAAAPGFPAHATRRSRTPLMLRAAVARSDVLRRIRDLHDAPMAKHRQDLVAEDPRALVIRDRERDVIQHRGVLQFGLAKASPRAAIGRRQRLSGRLDRSRGLRPVRLRRSCGTYAASWLRARSFSRRYGRTREASASMMPVALPGCSASSMKAEAGRTASSNVRASLCS